MAKSASLAAVAASFLLVAHAGLAQRNLNIASAPSSEQRVALIIGNSAYADAPLKNPINDAADVASTLRELGFHVVLRTNARQRDMKQAIREFGSSLARGGVGLFYFAGHGVQSKGRNFLVPIGAHIEREADVEDETVDASLVLAQMEEARNRVNIVILDACRNNPYSRGFRSATRGLAQMDATSGTLIAFATAPGSVAADGDGRNGVYTKHLLNQMRESGVPVELMLKRVRDGVMNETKDRQVPWESSSLRGADFYFRPTPPQPSLGAVAPLPAPDSSAVRLAKRHLLKGDQLLLQGRAVDADQEYQVAFEALRAFSPADLNDDGKIALGRLYVKVPNNYAAAAILLRPFADAGDALSQNELGVVYRDAVRGFKKDPQQAASWFRKAAEQGLAFSQYNLAGMYSDGKGVLQDDREAVHWYRKAADQGFADAQNALGGLYRDGKGVRQDHREAVLWFRKSAEQGNADGQLNLGLAYENGRGLTRDLTEARGWFERAAEQGNERAKDSLTRLQRGY